MVKMLNRYDYFEAMATTADLLKALRRFGLEDDRLERLGWVAREPHPSDRRSIVIRPLPPKSEAEQIYALFASALERAAAKLTAAERDAAVRFLEDAAIAARGQADRLRARPGSGRAPTGSPAPGSPPTPAA